MPTAFSRLSWGQAGALLVSASAYWGLAYATPRAHFGQLLLLFGIAVAAYVWLVRSRLPLRWGLGAALLLRLLWLPATPTLSDDFHRFRWDGLLSSHRISPFWISPHKLLNYSTINHYPSSNAGAYKAAKPTLLPLLQPLYPQLNSPRYFSVYPPVCQLIFQAGAWLFPTSSTGFVVFLRLFILLAEIGSAALLLRLLPAVGWPARRALSYLLHPLVIIELTGNLHFEALVIFFFLLTSWLLLQRRVAWAGGALALAVATKLLPLIALPLLVRRLGWQKFSLFSGALLGGIILLFAPFVSWALLVNISRSLNLYFQHFEFNASIFYLLRAWEFRLTGYDQIHRLGPELAALAASTILLLAARERRPTLASLPGVLLLAFCMYFVCATVVHPWYLTPLVALGVFTRLRFPLVWAALAFLSYSAYQTATYAEHMELITLEYLGVFIAAIGDFRRIMKQPKQLAAKPHSPTLP